MQRPKVSVIIPTYNRAHFIAEAIQSVLDQTFTDFEIIVVDDGSTDNTKEVVDSFKDSRIKYIYQENQWVTTARNNGIKASSGEYIAFLDSDDALMGNSLMRGMQVLEKHPEVGFSYGWDYLMDENGSVFGLSKKRQEHSCILEGSEQIREFLIYGNNLGTTCGTMARRSCLDQVGLFDPAFRSGSEDFDLFMRLAKKYAVASIAEPLGKYRIHTDKISGHRKLDELEKTHGLILESIFDDPDLGHLFSHLRSKAYFRLYLHFASIALERRETKTARRYLFKALKMYPKGFLKGLWLPWILRFGKTWILILLPQSIRRTRRYLRTAL